MKPQGVMKLFYEPKERLRLTVGEAVVLCDRETGVGRAAVASERLSHALMNGKGEEITRSSPEPGGTASAEILGGGRARIAATLPDRDGADDPARPPGVRSDLLDRRDRPGTARLRHAESSGERAVVLLETSTCFCSTSMETASDQNAGHQRPGCTRSQAYITAIL